MSRLEKSVKNIMLSFGNALMSSVLGLVSRTIFIAILGTEYLGLSGLLGNVLGFLTISELGIATAIGFSLYKPLAEKDYITVSALMSVYRKAYAIIGTFVAVSGIGLFCFLDFFIPPEQQPGGTSIAYFAFLLNTVLGYFLSYKITLISSDNQAYRLVPINVGLNILQTVAQIGALLFRSYIAYLFVQIGFSALIMAVQNRYITKKYSQVNFYSKDRLRPEQKRILGKNIGGLIVAKIGDYLVNSTDNLIITKLISLAATGIYSNYLLIRNMVNGFIATLFAGISASVGNVVAIETDQRKREIFDEIHFCAFFIYSVEAVCLLCLFNPFIQDIWIGEQYLFDMFTVTIIVINNFLTGLRIPLITMKGAAGIYMEDAWIPFAFAVINLVASIILARILGIAGVFLGTIIGSLLTADWYRPIVIYHKVFHTSVKQYYKKYLLYVVLGFAYMGVTYWLCSLVQFQNVVLGFVCKCGISGALPICCNIIVFHRTREFAAIRQMGLRLWAAVRKVSRRKEFRNDGNG